MKIKNIFGDLKLTGSDAEIVKEHISSTVLKLITLFFTAIANRMTFQQAITQLMQNAGPEGIVPASSVQIRCLLFANKRRDLFDDGQELLKEGDIYESRYGDTVVSLYKRREFDDNGIGEDFYSVDILMFRGETETDGTEIMEGVCHKTFKDEAQAIEYFGDVLELRWVFLKQQDSIATF